MFACVDLGSNSFHLLIARDEAGRMELVERFSVRVQLGEGVALDGRLTEAAVQRGLDALADFRDVIRAWPIECLWSVGTNALRRAANRDVFLEPAARLGFPIEVIDGEREAELVYAGVCSRRDDTTRRLVVDVGGGSTEVIAGTGHRPRWACSLPLGCVSWRDRFFAHLDRNAGTDAVDAALLAAREEAGGLFQEACDRGAGELESFEEALASSGTAKMLARVGAASGYPADLISRDSLDRLHGDGWLHRQVEQPDGLVPGLKPARRDLLLPGWSLMAAFMETFGADTVAFSRDALREGMLDTMRALRDRPDREAFSAAMRWYESTTP